MEVAEKKYVSENNLLERLKKASSRRIEFRRPAPKVTVPEWYAGETFHKEYIESHLH